jgi:hypothetical protein
VLRVISTKRCEWRAGNYKQQASVTYCNVLSRHIPSRDSGTAFKKNLPGYAVSQLTSTLTQNMYPSLFTHMFTNTYNFKAIGPRKFKLNSSEFVCNKSSNSVP